MSRKRGSLTATALGLAVGLPLLAYGLLGTPTGPSGAWDPERVDRGEAVDSPTRRWIPIQVPPGMELGEFLDAYRLNPPNRWFRTSAAAGGDNLDDKDVATHRGPLWMATGGAPPVTGPDPEVGVTTAR